MPGNFHEQHRQEEPPLPSERSTGLVFAALALIVALLWRGNPWVWPAALATAAAFAAVSLAAPLWLRPLNIAWMGLAHALNRIASPLVMLVLFAVVIVPAGLIMQRSYDPLRKRRGDDSSSYWIDRGAARADQSMRNQF